jgi:ribosome-associated toxin RatA of RatAB toxin-antitoxin module
MQNQTEKAALGVQHHTEHTTTVEAPLSVVFEVLADVEGYVRLFPPTRAVEVLEEDESHQIARLVVEVGGEELSWVTRRDIDRDRGVIAYRQLQTAPLMDNMGGEWRCYPLGEHKTQLVITHDFAAREPAGKNLSLEEADRVVREAVERNSHVDLAAVKEESERRYGRLS